MLKVKEVALKFGVSEKTIWRWLKSGKLKYYRLGRKTIRISETDLDAFIAERGTEPGKEKTLMVGATSSQVDRENIAGGGAGLEHGDASKERLSKPRGRR